MHDPRCLQFTVFIDFRYNKIKSIPSFGVQAPISLSESSLPNSNVKGFARLVAGEQFFQQKYQTQKHDSPLQQNEILRMMEAPCYNNVTVVRTAWQVPSGFVAFCHKRCVKVDLRNAPGRDQRRQIDAFLNGTVLDDLVTN